MNLFLAGLDHTTAPVEIREQLAFSQTDLPSALLQLTQAGNGSPPLFSEAVILSTCNRVEIYGVANPGTTAQHVVDFLANFHRRPACSFVYTLYFYQGESVARHLCATAAGLRSLVLGEAQIQGQVRSAYEAAQRIGSVSSVLHRLFQIALVAGKRVRHETTIGKGAASVSQAGVELARRRLGDLRGREVLLIGGGEVSELAAQNLIANGANRLTIVNRTSARAAALAERYGAEMLDFGALPEALARADIVISSTAAPVPIIYRHHVAEALAHKQRMRACGDCDPPAMLLIDLAVPRDIAADVAELPGVHLFTVDDLREVVSHTIELRSAMIDIANRIVEEQVREFSDWLRTQEALPVLTMLRQRAEEVRNEELTRALRRLHDLSPEQRAVIEGLSRSIVNKLLHPPIRCLREAAAHGQGKRYATVLAELFNLEHALEHKAGSTGNTDRSRKVSDVTL
ncbi:MAG: glutamyl-tRNA reductase [Chloroflexus aggregans]|uniref:Glutamyl-tRNA reductase n=1 Tax=Chloroflexus aggregans TaxID=152260 RepID=A0A2J6X2I7_9CHLR|nr:MAG: glutamyl-tRNA reductase [Chloroflexus aggregans]